MIPWQEMTVLAAAVLLFSAIRSAWLRSRDRKERDAERKLELVLKPRETIRAICPQKKGRCILTSKRVLFETPDGFQTVEIKAIQKVQGTNEKGNRTTSVAKMVSLTIKADETWEIQNTHEAFAPLAEALITKIRKQNEKKKAAARKKEAADQV